MHARGCGSLAAQGAKVDPFCKINPARYRYLDYLAVCVLAITPRCAGKTTLLLARARKLN